MVEFAKILLEGIIVFLLIYFGYYLFGYKKIKKYNRKKASTGVKYLIYKYNIDVAKIGYKRIYKMLMLADSSIVSFLFVITSYVSNIYLRLVIVFFLVFPVFAGVYHLIAKYLIKESE